MDIEDIKDIRGPVNFPPSYFFLIVIGAIVLIVGLVFLAIYLIKKRRLIAEQTPYVEPRPAHDIAYEALKALQAKCLPDHGLIKEYYFQLSNIARHYLEDRFSFKAPEMTTEEFLYSLRDSNELTGSHKNLLKEFLSQSDMVKFAKYGPTASEIDESFAHALRLVDETKNVDDDKNTSLQRSETTYRLCEAP
ncbi:hypothetical protein ACFL0T_07185 [Candidatus Omnitrophota bacterium]